MALTSFVVRLIPLAEGYGKPLKPDGYRCAISDVHVRLSSNDRNILSAVRMRTETDNITSLRIFTDGIDLNGVLDVEPILETSGIEPLAVLFKDHRCESHVDLVNIGENSLWCRQ